MEKVYMIQRSPRAMTILLAVVVVFETVLTGLATVESVVGSLPPLVICAAAVPSLFFAEQGTTIADVAAVEERLGQLSLFFAP